MGIKIERGIKYRNLPYHVKEHLSFVDVNNTKWGAATFVISLYNIPLILSFLAVMKIELLWLLAPLMIILYAWMVRLLIKNPYSTQLEMVLFLGIYGLIGTITYFFMLHAISYFSLNILSITYYLFLNLIILIVSFIIIKWQVRKYNNIEFKHDQAENQNRSMTAIVVVPALGFILGDYISGTTVFKYYYVIGMDLFLLFLFVYIGTKFTHRYFFIKANMDYVTYQKPPKKNSVKKGLLLNNAASFTNRILSRRAAVNRVSHRKKR